jgi:broad specificity phosphatase PhoE
MLPQHLVRAALKKLTLLLAAATLLNEAKRKKNAPLRLLPDRTFAAARAKEELKTVYFLRHGESQWNEAQANRNPIDMFGRFDHALTAEGLAQADRLATRISDSSKFSEARRAFDKCTAIYCSPLTRALQTCLVALRDHPCLRAKGAGVTLVPACRELCYPVGGFDSLRGTTGASILKRAVRRTKKVGKAAQLAPIVAGTVKVDVSEAEADWWGPEGQRGVTDRMQAFVDRLRTSEDDDVIVVGHSLFFRTVFDNFASADAKARDPTLLHLSKKKLRNAAVARVTLNCSAARYPIIGAELAFPEEEE